MPPLAPVLLRLAEAIGPDGAARVPVLLGELLRPIAEYEAAELVIRDAVALRRFPVGPGGGPLLANDFLEHLLQARHAMRVDEPAEVLPYPDTATLLVAAGVTSILAVPFSTAGVHGALVLGRTFSWSLVGVSLSLLEPMVTMAGVALHRSLQLEGTAPAPRVAEPGGPAETPTFDRRSERRRRRR